MSAAPLMDHALSMLAPAVTFGTTKSLAVVRSLLMFVNEQVVLLTQDVGSCQKQSLYLFAQFVVSAIHFTWRIAPLWSSRTGDEGQDKTVIDSYGQC